MNSSRLTWSTWKGGLSNQTFYPLISDHVTFTYRRDPIDTRLTLSNTEISKSNTKYLGVAMQSKLKWNTHMNFITTKANSILGFDTGHIISSTQKLHSTCYSALLHPILEYAFSTWDSSRRGIWRLFSVEPYATYVLCCMHYIVQVWGRSPSVYDWATTKSRVAISSCP